MGIMPSSTAVKDVLERPNRTFTDSTEDRLDLSQYPAPLENSANILLGYKTREKPKSFFVVGKVWSLILLGTGCVECSAGFCIVMA
jgi:hypothetical protein